MRIAQILLPDASEYERKSQRIDRAALAASHDVIEVALGDIASAHADVAHVYASHKLPAAPFVRFPIPYVASADVARSRWPFRKPEEPDYIISPLANTIVPEAVEERFWSAAAASPFSPPRGEKVPEGRMRGWPLATRPPHPPSAPSSPSPGEKELAAAAALQIASFRRTQILPLVQQTLARIQRTRDDVVWHLFDRVPSPEDLQTVDLWVDPAIDDADLDGFVAEALVCETPVVATRTAINNQRLEKGRTGFLVPCNDPNELAHAILTALFKPEVAERKIEAAKQTVSKFRHRQRLRILGHLYETLTR